MEEIEERTESAPLNRTRLIGGALDVGGTMLAFAALAWAVLRFWQIFGAETVSPVDAAQTVVLTLLGLGAAAFFFSAGEATRKLEDLSELLRGSASAPESAAGPVAFRSDQEHGGPTVAERQTMLELVGLMREVRDISLLSDEQRSARVAAQADDLSRRLQREVPELLRQHKWFAAFKRVRAARERFPTLEVWDELAKQIQAVRGQVESRDIEAATRQVNELTALSAWDRAQDVARDLLERHPKADGAIEIARRVRVQRDKAEAELRARLMAQAQGSTDKHEWPDALNAARSLIERFPNSAEAEALREQLPILEANAEVKSRQLMEANIRELVTQRRYEEAVRLARQLIARYPNSPQAGVLHDQLPRLEEKAAALG
jgi:tetratricopeptide (TPR) repeat protein